MLGSKATLLIVQGYVDARANRGEEPGQRALADLTGTLDDDNGSVFESRDDTR